MTSIVSACTSKSHKIRRLFKLSHCTVLQRFKIRQYSLSCMPSLSKTVQEGPEGEQMYSSTLPSNSALDGGGWSTPRPGRFTPGKTRNPLYRRLGAPQGRSGRVLKISAPPGFDPRTAQSVASRLRD